MLAKLKKTHVAQETLTALLKGLTRRRKRSCSGFTDGDGPICTKERKEKRGRGTETLVPKKEVGLVAGDKLFDFGLTFEDIEREIDAR